MTVGSVEMDGRVTVHPPGWYSYRFGPWKKKSWNGADRAVTPKPQRTKTTIQLVVYKKVGVRFSRRTGRYYTKREPATVERVLKSAYVKPKRRPLDTEPHQYSCSGLDLYDPLVEMRYSDDPGFYPSSFRAQFSEPTSTYSWTPNDDIALIAKLREKIVGSDFDPGVFLAEAPQALQMIGTAAQKIGKSIEYAYKGNWREAFFQVSATRIPSGVKKASQDVAASNWLELQYGWTPLLKDAESSAQFLAYMLNATLMKRYSASRRRAESLLFQDPRVVFPSDGNKSHTRAKIVAYFREDRNVQMALLSNPALVVWEKIPYSFVIDWFAPIGTYLDARGVAQNLSGTFVKSEKTLLDASNPYSTGSAVNGWRYGSGDLSSFRIKRWTFGRTVLDSLQVPLPTVKSLGSIASWKHTANAVALLTQKRGMLKDLYDRYRGS